MAVSLLFIRDAGMVALSALPIHWVEKFPQLVDSQNKSFNDAECWRILCCYLGYDF